MLEILVKQSGEEIEGKVYIGTDDVPIKKATDYAQSKGGGRVFIDEGTYTIKKEMNIGSNVEICGCGNKTLIRRDSDIHTFVATLSDNIYMHDLSFDDRSGFPAFEGNKSKNIKITYCKGISIFANECPNLELAYNEVTGSSMTYSWYLNKCNDLSVYNNHASGINIWLTLMECYISKVCNNHVTLCSSYSIYSTKSKFISIENNIISGNKERDSLVNISCCTHTKVHNNIITNSKDISVDLNTVTDISISGNIINNNNMGIRILEGSNKALVVTKNILLCSRNVNSLYISDCNNLILSYNIIDQHETGSVACFQNGHSICINNNITSGDYVVNSNCSTSRNNNIEFNDNSKSRGGSFI